MPFPNSLEKVWNEGPNFVQARSYAASEQYSRCWGSEWHRLCSGRTSDDRKLLERALRPASLGGSRLVQC